MRELINLIESKSVLVESTGLANRKPGERWANDQGAELTFRSLEFFPQGGGEFQGPDELIGAKAEVVDTPGLQVHWTNVASSRTKAFGIATFDDSQGNPVYVGKFFGKIHPNFANNFWANGDILPGFKYQSRAAKKESGGHKPSEILTQFQSNTPDSIARQVIEKFGANSDENRAMQAFLRATSFPIRIPKGNLQLESFRDYFCEMLQPIALINGLPIKGNAAEASDIFFGKGVGYGSCVISFNEGVSGGLYDSLLVNDDGKQIKLSSKGASGANASVVNFLRCIEELDVAPKGRKLLAKHSSVIDIIRIIDAGGHFGGPLELAANYGIIDQDDIHFVPLLKDISPRDTIDWGKHKKLRALYEARKAANPAAMVPAEHMIAAIAYKVAEYVNKNTNFSEAASDILNHSALVQMYTQVKESGNELLITEFEAKYPSNTVTGVQLRADKTYMSTAKGGGNMTFKILKNGAKESDVEDQDSQEQSAPAAPSAVTGKRVSRDDISSGPGKKGGKANLGRASR